MGEKLNFGNAENENRFAAFDSANDPFALFDEADGATSIPPGTYLCLLERGEALITKTNKPAYRMRFKVADGPHKGFTLWRYFTFHDKVNADRAKVALSPLGLKTSADLKMQFPSLNRVITCKVLVTVRNRPDGTPSNDVERFDVVSDQVTQPSPFAVELPGKDVLEP